jgi:hypothetical protein
MQIVQNVGLNRLMVFQKYTCSANCSLLCVQVGGGKQLPLPLEEFIQDYLPVSGIHHNISVTPSSSSVATVRHGPTAARISDYNLVMNGLVTVNDKLERMQSWLNLRYYPRICQM